MILNEFLNFNIYLFIIPLIVGLILDLIFGDPRSIPHLIVGFGNMIIILEKRFNNGSYKTIKGILITGLLIAFIYTASYFIIFLSLKYSILLYYIIASIFVFYCLSHKSLLQEGDEVLYQLETNGLDAGRKRLSWIVGRETDKLSAQQIRIAVFETVSENLSDGVIAPLFWYAIAGLPGIVTYKIINTLDSMIGYKSNRYKDFGMFAAKLDDVVNYLPARITAILMVLSSFSIRGLNFVFKYGKKHSSPNSGYPEAALAGILNCQFGGPNFYHGQLVEKPYIGNNSRNVESWEFKKVKNINHKTTLIFFLIVIAIAFFIF